VADIIEVPDIGGAEQVEVIEVLIAPGDEIAAEQSLIVLESDKASMEVPSPRSGKVARLLVKVGDKVRAGVPILELEGSGAAVAAPEKAAEKVAEKAPATAQPAASSAASSAPASKPAVTSGGGIEAVAIPDLGTSDAVDVIELCVAVGDRVAEGDSIVVLESDKASMEVPSPKAGVVRALKVKVGDKVTQGSPLMDLEVDGGTAGVVAEAVAELAAPASVSTVSASVPTLTAMPAPVLSAASVIDDDAPRELPMPTAVGEVYAGPAVRKLAREMGIDLLRVPGSGPRGRIQKEDVKRFVKTLMAARSSQAPVSGSGIPPIPPFDASQFGEVDIQPLSKLHKLTAANMQRAWLNIPHVTQFDDADITELEEFRNSLKIEMEKRGVKLTLLPFLLKACAAALKSNPKFNASLHGDGERIVYKKYVHIGIAVDTPAGLVVPVIRDVDKKGLWELAAESAELAAKARDRKLKPADMQGGCFSISSLGNIGGLGFTPIINAPEVAILAVSRLTVKPQWDGKQFVPRKMLPLSLSYDHRAINGADAGRFFTQLNELLGDIRRLLL
jgi:pyruvate dehydrogenase E2 component (dihydrolipoamide acetyltransferase)